MYVSISRIGWMIVLVVEREDMKVLMPLLRVHVLRLMPLFSERYCPQRRRLSITTLIGIRMRAKFVRRPCAL